jgi:hypothetical protein
MALSPHKMVGKIALIVPGFPENRNSPTVPLTVVIMHTISQSGVAAHPNGAHVAWAGSNAADIHEAFLSIGCALICFRYLL